jgi:hypothetical protein
VTYDLHWRERSAEHEEAAYFQANNRTWSLLVDEMDRKGMLKCVDDRRDVDTGPGGIPLHKLSSNDGWLVTPAEIEWALEYRDGDEPLELSDPRLPAAKFVTEDEALELVREGYEIGPLLSGGGRVAVGRFPPDQAGWRLKWFDLLVYLSGAANHGGFYGY